MERNIFEKQRDLNDRLNRYRDEYYNRNAPSVSDEVYDRLFDELKELEQETGIQMANSPTQTVGYPAVSRLEKTRHEIPLLSLDKTDVYKRQLLLAMLPLQLAHRNHLRSPKRGLSDEQIDRIGFKSTPPPFLCRSITERLMKQGCKVEGAVSYTHLEVYKRQLITTA